MQRTTSGTDWNGERWAPPAVDAVRHPLRSRLERAPSRGTTPRHPAEAPPARRTERAPPRRSGLRANIAFVVLGFVFGAVFWHFVGFWDFVGQVMFKGRADVGQSASAPPPVKLRERAPGAAALAVVIEPSSCTTLQLDRATGTTVAAECAPDALPLRSLKTARREDMWVTASQRMQEATARRWSAVTVERPEQRQDQASAD